jgi:hypothetical protein
MLTWLVSVFSEYMVQIEEFVSGIMDAGFAYESNGSVYFDVAKFSTAPNCDYAKLCPWSVGNPKLVAEGEGALRLDEICVLPHFLSPLSFLMSHTSLTMIYLSALVVSMF